MRNHSHKRDSNVAKVLAQLFLTSVTWNYLVQVECKLECFSMLHCCLYVLWTVFGAGILCVFGWVVSLFVAIFWACSTVCLCLFWSLLFNEVLCDFVCPCVYTIREKVWTGANPLGELGAHTHRAGPAHNNTLRPHRWLPPQQMTSAAEESSCLPIDTFNHRSLTEGPSF